MFEMLLDLAILEPYTKDFDELTQIPLWIMKAVNYAKQVEKGTLNSLDM